jgi:hypothetical protein
VLIQFPWNLLHQSIGLKDMTTQKILHAHSESFAIEFTEPQELFSHDLHPHHPLNKQKNKASEPYTTTQYKKKISRGAPPTQAARCAQDSNTAARRDLPDPSG